MPGKAPIPSCTDKDREFLEQIVRSRTMELRMVERARIILKCLAGYRVKEIAKVLQVRPNTVIEWRRRFEKEGVKGLKDKPRSGKPARYDAEFRKNVFDTLKLPPPSGQAHWDGPAIAKHLDTSVHAVWRLLRKEGICLSRQRSWTVSTGLEFAPKAADIVGLYLSPTANALVICVDEKPDLYGFECAAGYVETDSGKIARGFKSRYKRNGFLNLFSALEAAACALQTQTCPHRRRLDFETFIEQQLCGLPLNRDIHVILDNCAIRDGIERWRLTHENVHFHSTATFGSWLTQVEIWFDVMSSKPPRGDGLESGQNLRQAIEVFVSACSPGARPFVWRKQETSGFRLRDAVAELNN
ncbi:MAG: IS630 family transposase [Syntrophobacteraceae bacterium]